MIDALAKQAIAKRIIADEEELKEQPSTEHASFLAVLKRIH